MSVRNLFYVSYWFSQPYIAHGALFNLFLALFLALIAGSLVALLVRRTRTDSAEKRVLGRLGSGLFGFGFLGLLWFFFREQDVAVLAWRIWPLIGAVWFVYWAAKLTRYMIVRMPQIRAEHKAKAEKEKYLPKK